jgi:hypothetical protein
VFNIQLVNITKGRKNWKGFPFTFFLFISKKGEGNDWVSKLRNQKSEGKNEGPQKNKRVGKREIYIERER